MKHVKRGRFLYDHSSHKTECVVDVLEDDVKVYVVFTEKAGNKNVSITNSIEDACNTYLETQGITNPNRVVFLERYEAHPEYLDRVHFDNVDASRKERKLQNPHWTRFPQWEANSILRLMDAL